MEREIYIEKGRDGERERERETARRKQTNRQTDKHTGRQKTLNKNFTCCSTAKKTGDSHYQLPIQAQLCTNNNGFTQKPLVCPLTVEPVPLWLNLPGSS